MGAEYRLPKADMSAQIVYQSERGFALRLALLPTVPDDGAQRFYLNYRGSPTENDKVQISVEEGLLTSTSIASESKLLDTGQGLGESAGAILGLESAVEDDYEVVGTVRFDPTRASEVSTASRELTTALHAFASESRTLSAIEAPLKKGDAAGLATRALRDRIIQNASTATIDLSSAFGTAAASGNVDCTPGVCYRQLRPGTVTVKVNGATFVQVGVNVPNGAPAVVFPLNRSGAANSGTDLVFDRGVLKSAKVTKDAEAPNIVRVPGTLIAGVFKGFTDTLTARKGRLGAETDLLTAQTAHADAQVKLIEAREALRKKRIGPTAIEASIEDTAKGSIWLPGLSFRRPTPAPPQAAKKVPDTELKPRQQASKPGDAGVPGGGGDPGGGGAGDDEKSGAAGQPTSEKAGSGGGS